MIRFRCERCGKALKLEDHAAGEVGTCGGCGNLIKAPASSARRAESGPMISPAAILRAPTRRGVQPDDPWVRPNARPDLWPADEVPPGAGPANDDVLQLRDQPLPAAPPPRPAPPRPTSAPVHPYASAAVPAEMASAGAPSAAENREQREITKAAKWLRGFAAVLTMAGAVQLAVGAVGLLAAIPGNVRASAVMNGLQFRTGVLICLTYGGAVFLVLAPVLRMIAAAGLALWDLASAFERGRQG